MPGRSVTLGPKSVEKHLIKGTAKYLTTLIGGIVHTGWPLDLEARRCLFPERCNLDRRVPAASTTYQ